MIQSVKYCMIGSDKIRYEIKLVRTVQKVLHHASYNHDLKKTLTNVIFCSNGNRFSYCRAIFLKYNAQAHSPNVSVLVFFPGFHLT